MSQFMCSLVLSASFCVAFVCCDSLGSAGLGHRIVFLACILVFVFNPFLIEYFVICFRSCSFKTCIILLVVSIARFCMF